MTSDTTTWNFTYNADGLRTKRTDGTTTYEYTYNGSSLSQMTVGSNTLRFAYDANGLPMSVAYNGTEYYYVTNIQGDIIAILDTTGNTVVTYTYDAWGNILSTGGTLSTTLGIHNPLRYRGYVYDTETRLYYLQSRYYNPTVGRFINADVYTATGHGLLGNNMYAYCLNNPVMQCDPTGGIAITTLILVGSAILGLAAASYTAYVEYNAGVDTEQIIFDSVINGLLVFNTVYSMGSSLYLLYQNYCYLNSITPVTDVGRNTTSMPNGSQQLQECADDVNSTISGTGPAVGTNKHTQFTTNVNQLGNSNIRTEVSYLNQAEVPYGTKGSARFDALLYDAGGNPIAAWDLKTGVAVLTQSRIEYMQRQSGLQIPIFMIK